jgi:hypothetical protein
LEIDPLITLDEILANAAGSQRKQLLRVVGRLKELLDFKPKTADYTSKKVLE